MQSIKQDRGHTLVCLLGILLILFSLLFLSVDISMGSRAYYEDLFARLDNAEAMGMSDEDLTDATVRMVDYMRGRVDSIDMEVTVHGELVSMFNEQERIHMLDVQNLYLGIKAVAIASAVIGVVIFAFELYKKRYMCVSKGIMLGSLVFFGIVVVLGAWVALDFYTFWTAFHEVFFTNDLWLFDPATSRMINMLPLEFFNDIVIRLGLMFVGMWAAVLAAGLLLRRKAR